MLGDDGLRMMEGAMEGLVDDVLNENLRITSDDDGDTHVTGATPSISATSITAGSSSSTLTP